MDDVTNDYLQTHGDKTDAELQAMVDHVDSPDYRDPSISVSPLGDMEVETPDIVVSSKRLTEADLTDEEKAQLHAEQNQMSIGDVAKDIVSSAGQGFVNANTEFLHSAAVAADAVIPFQDDPEAVQKFIEEHAPRMTDDDYESIGIPATKTMAGGFVKSTTQFLTGFIPAMRGMKAMSALSSAGTAATVAKSAAGAGTAGVVASMANFNPYEARITNWVASLDQPQITKDVADYLKADDADPEALARIKMGIEGVLVGKVAGTALKGTMALVGKALDSVGLYKTAAKAHAVQTGVNGADAVEPSYVVDPSTGAKVKLDIPGVRVSQKVPSVKMPSEEDLSNFATDYLDGNYENAAQRAAGHVNLKHINTDEDVVALIEGMSQVRHTALGKNYRSWATAAQKAGKLGADSIPEYSARVQGLDSQVVKATEARNAVAYKARELANIAKAHPSPVTMAEFQQAWKVLNVLDAHVSQNATEIARALAIMRRTSSTGGMVGAIKNVASKVLGADGATDWELLAHMVGELPDSAAMLKMVKASRLPNWKDAAVELYINALFSPITLVKNVAATTLSTASSIPERYLGALKSQFGGSGELTIREANHYALGYVKAFPEAFRVLKKAWVEQAPQIGAEVNEFAGVLKPHGISKEAFGITAESGTIMQHLGMGIDLFGTAVRGMPGGTRSLLATDEAMKAFVYRAELGALAHREAAKAGLKGGTPEYAKKLLDIEAGVLSKDPGNAYYGLKMSAISAAHRGTFTEDFGKGGEALLQSLRHYRLSYIPFTFIKTPINLLKWMGRRTPGVAGFSSFMQGEINAGGARADLARSQLALGSMYTAAGMALAGAGYLQGDITANWTIARNMRALGIGKSSIVNKDTGEQYEIGSFDGTPLSFLLFAATTGETIEAYIEHNKDRLDDNELADKVMEIASIPIEAATKYALNKSWATGMASLLDAAQNGGLAEYAQRTAGSFVPFGNTLKWFNQQSGTDPYARELDSTLEEIRAKIPKFSRDIAPIPTLLGDPSEVRQYEALGLAPVSVAVPKDHPVYQELSRLQRLSPNEVVMGGVPKMVGDVKLDNAEQWNYMQFVRFLKDGKGKDLVEGLEDVMADPAYQKAPDSLKNELLTKIYNNRKSLAERALQWDAAAAYDGQDRPYAEDFRLYPYKRKNSITDHIANEKAIKLKERAGGVFPNGMSMSSFMGDYRDSVLKANLGTVIH